MELYQSEGSGRTIRIFIIGLVGLVAVFFVVVKQAFAITILSVIPIALVFVGFLAPRRKSISAVLPPLGDDKPRFATQGVDAQPYPQFVSYRVSLKNLHLLFIPIGVAAGLISLVWVGVIKDFADNPLPLYGALAAIFFASLFALRWVNERGWVSRAVGNYAISNDGHAILLLCSPDAPEAGPVALACRYHRFEVMDVQHNTGT